MAETVILYVLKEELTLMKTVKATASGSDAHSEDSISTAQSNLLSL